VLPRSGNPAPRHGEWILHVASEPASASRQILTLTTTGTAKVGVDGS
jgi:hypothetical protein